MASTDNSNASANPRHVTGARRRVAVVGTGIGGLTAAWLLQRDFDVTVFERHERPGMGIFSVDYQSNGITTRIDIPTRIFCAGYYPNLLALFREIGVQMHETNHSGAFADSAGELFLHYGEFNLAGQSLRFPKGRSTLTRRARQIVVDGTRFVRHARRDMGQPEQLANITLADYLTQTSCGDAFVQDLLLPILSVTLTCDYKGVLAYPADLVLGYVTSGVLHQRLMRAELGVDDIVPRLLDGVDQVCGVSVDRVEPDGDGYTIHTADGTPHHFDQVVLATQAQEAAPMLRGLPRYSQLLRTVPFEQSRMVVHTDPSVLPRSTLPLSPVTYHVPQDAPRPEVTVNMTKAFATYAGQQPVFQTWNPIQAVSEECHIATADFTRPLVTLESRQAVTELRALQAAQNRGLWLCGAYMGDRIPLLEAAVDSAVTVAETMGARIPWMHAA